MQEILKHEMRKAQLTDPRLKEQTVNRQLQYQQHVASMSIERLRKTQEWNFDPP